MKDLTSINNPTSVRIFPTLRASFLQMESSLMIQRLNRLLVTRQGKHDPLRCINW
ncbi:hypothetical protein M378DRAFT_169839 [Amanita muscaria Koide BX008]|uniref:Uncharacterized protein n=1 Tax=Amanita muscaria (strain Koide BX008) TaxID=946122 RepID=A0A0C2WCQ4_AMAMK|nr:hypothetical protein M378DRAFT_169839 [Amanita muscaria Koide BX008]